MKILKTLPFQRPSSSALTAGFISLFAALATSHVHAERISQVYIFGDSSTDVGSGPNGLPRPTNKGLMWGEVVGNALGHPSTAARIVTIDGDGTITGAPNGGNNYAVSGATVTKFADSVSFAEEIAFFTQDKTRFGKNDLVFTWFGSNDITGSFIDGVPYSQEQYVNTYLVNIAALRQRGAKNIVSIVEPQGSLQPVQWTLDAFGGFFTTDNIDYLSDEIAAANAALNPRLVATGVYLIAADKLAEDVRLNLGKYGFLYGTDNYITLDDATSFPNDGNVFANGHYSTAMHAVIGDYILAQLRARDQFTSVLTQSMFTFQQETGELAQANTLTSFLESDSHGRVHQRETGTWKTQAGLTGRSSTEADTVGTDTDLVTGQGGGYVAGNVAMSNDWLLGGRFSYTKSDGKFGDSLSSNQREGEDGSLDQSTAMLSLYSVHRLTESAYLNAMVSYGATRYDNINRRASLGSVAKEQTQGDTTGDFLSASIGGGYEIPLGNWTITPNASVSYDRISIAGYSERQDVLALAYGDADYDALRGSLGVRAQLTGGTSKLRPFFGLNVSRDFIADDITVKVGPDRASVVDYTTERPNRIVGTASVGANYILKDNLVLGSTLTFGGTLDGDRSTYLGLSLDVGFSF
jgi:outer membrane lipase/esterase